MLSHRHSKGSVVCAVLGVAVSFFICGNPSAATISVDKYTTEKCEAFMEETSEAIKQPLKKFSEPQVFFAYGELPKSISVVFNTDSDSYVVKGNTSKINLVYWLPAKFGPKEDVILLDMRGLEIARVNNNSRDRERTIRLSRSALQDQCASGFPNKAFNKEYNLQLYALEMRNSKTRLGNKTRPMHFYFKYRGDDCKSTDSHDWRKKVFGVGDIETKKELLAKGVSTSPEGGEKKDIWTYILSAVGLRQAHASVEGDKVISKIDNDKSVFVNRHNHHLFKVKRDEHPMCIFVSISSVSLIRRLVLGITHLSGYEEDVPNSVTVVDFSDQRP